VVLNVFNDNFVNDMEGRIKLTTNVKFRYKNDKNEILGMKMIINLNLKDII
jgi:hypothetical protein